MWVEKYLIQYSVSLRKWDGTAYHDLTLNWHDTRGLTYLAGEQLDADAIEVLADELVTWATPDLLRGTRSALDALRWVQPELPF